MDADTAAFAVVVPAYNEGAGIRVHLERIADTLGGLGAVHALIVVDDGSTDDTRAGIEATHVPPSVEFRAVVHASNRGYGAALRSGAACAAELGRGWILFMDADGTNPPEHIARFVEAARPGVDHLKATRYGAGAGVIGVPWARRTLSRFGNALARLLLRRAPRDTTNGFRAIRTNEALAMPLSESGFPVIMEELRWAYRHGLWGDDVPTTLGTRSETQRATSLGYRPSTMWRYFRHVLGATADRARRRSTHGWRVVR